MAGVLEYKDSWCRKYAEAMGALGWEIAIDN